MDRDRQGGDAQVADRAALLRLAGAGRARRLVPARRADAGRRARSRSVKGSRIEHDGLREFIQRNYEADARGCWYFQNGPQRVYVELEAAPWVFRLDVGRPAGPASRWRISLPGERQARYRAAWLDEHGRLFLDCDLGFGLVHSLDTDVAALAIEAGDWQPRRDGVRPHAGAFRLSCCGRRPTAART